MAELGYTKRRVISAEPVEQESGKWILKLECDHTIKVKAKHKPLDKARHCRACLEAAKAAS